MSATASVGLGVGAAACFAIATAAQHRSAGDVPEAGGLQPRAVVAFASATLRQPLWLLGVVADLIGLTCHVLALSQGSLALVQPLLISGLLFGVLVRPHNSRRVGGPPRPQGQLVNEQLRLTLVAPPPSGHDRSDKVRHDDHPVPCILRLSASRLISDTLAAGGQTAASARSGADCGRQRLPGGHTCSAGTISGSVLAEVEVGALVVGAL